MSCAQNDVLFRRVRLRRVRLRWRALKMACASHGVRLRWRALNYILIVIFI